MHDENSPPDAAGNGANSRSRQRRGGPRNLKRTDMRELVEDMRVCLSGLLLSDRMDQKAYNLVMSDLWGL